MAANLQEELFEFLVVERTESSHRLIGNGNLDGFIFLADNPRGSPLVFHFLPAALFQNFFPCSLFADLFNEEFESSGKRLLGVFKRVSMSREVKRWGVAKKYLPFFEVNDRNISFDARLLQHDMITS